MIKDDDRLEEGAEDNFRDLRTSNERRIDGRNRWREVMASEPPVESSAYMANGILDFAYGVVWNRPGLARRDRRWITLTAVAASGAVGPIESHIRAAMLSGDFTYQEMREFVLQCAVYLGWPKASVLNVAIEKIHHEILESGNVVGAPSNSETS